MKWIKYLLFNTFTVIKVSLDVCEIVCISLIKITVTVYCIFVVCGFIKTLFFINYVNIYLFLKFFSIEFARWKSVGLPLHCLYLDSLFLNFLLFQHCSIEIMSSWVLPHSCIMSQIRHTANAARFLKCVWPFWDMN